ncbi:helix-turn-helix domain-containing protein [Burkholderia vietnamiensis]|uniref:helix-turn-helix domain-containing protein n=1 Tax=Burkholderia vietnamiensis TaxID=60552 RepID=UPI00075668A5|nr:helix-turn-helix domain-containing protein [Burkholderia vietnamiensis]KVF22138.1 hypothetical protein WJ07_17895 [Burkholderia vietnamiensis]
MIVDIVADMDETAREVILTIHCQGGQHSQLRVRKPRTGEHGCSTSDDVLAVIRSMITRWSNQDIAASLNRMGIRTGHGKPWTVPRVRSMWQVCDIRAYKSAVKDGQWLTMSDAAKLFGVTHYMTRRLTNDHVLPPEQAMPDTPWQIRASDLRSDAVAAALARKYPPCRNDNEAQVPMFIEVSKGSTQ